MLETLINHPKLAVKRKTGTEGPKHDPYAYVELHVMTPRGEIVLHRGLGDWIMFNSDGERIDRFTKNGGEIMLENVLWVFTGWRISQIERIARRLKERCTNCGGKSFHSERGYPGEHFDVCDNCDHINGGYFCESEVI